MASLVSFALQGGARCEGALAEPAGTQKAGAVVVVQEWWGLNDQIRSLCDRFAAAGMLALAPDLFEGKRPKTTEEAGQTMAALDKTKAVARIGDAAAFLKSQPRSNGKVAVVGFCMGGALTFASARYVDGIAAAVPFYGIPDLAMEEYAKIRVPIQAHFAQRDDWAKPAVAEKIAEQVKNGGGKMDLFLYDAGHAFMRDTDAQVYVKDAAKTAWDRAIAFLGAHLKG
ncbi:MAG TPA: dienelactone hydrolase family protein [Polyangiaceae bacterium]|nr:dienelactone hydrolase family protein [Polyangiaceae bacterium]